MPEIRKIATHPSEFIRQVNAAQDMPAILDLVEIGFQNELDPQGWKMLRQMRRIYQPGFLAHLLQAPPGNTAGFVWVEDGRIIGNLSLRRAMPQSSQGRMIGNVVVHPDYRGRGIGRALMMRAMQHAQHHHAAWIGLEVRSDNAIACQLYRHLGFRPVGHVQHMIRSGDLGWPNVPRSQRTWRASKPDDSERWAELAQYVYSYDQRRVLEIQKSSYRFGGLGRWLQAWTTLRRERAWISKGQDRDIQLATHVETECRYHFHVWDLLMHPSESVQGAGELVAKSLASVRGFPAWPVIAMIPHVPSLIKAMQGVGFKIHRTLQQMILDL